MNRAWKRSAQPGEDHPRPSTSSGTHLLPSELLDAEPCRDFEDVYRRTRAYVQRSLRRRVPAEAVDDVFQRVFVTLDRKIREGGGVPPRIMHLLNEVIVGEVKNHRRTAGRCRIDGEPDAETAPSSWPNPEQRFLAAEHDDRVAAAAQAVLASLTEAERRLLLLANTEGLTHREIGELLDRPPGSIGVELQRARLKARRAAAPYHDLLNGSRRKTK